MALTTIARFITVEQDLPPTDIVPISAPLETPWYIQTWDLFGVIEVSVLFLIILAVLLLAGVVYFILQGYLKEVKRQKAQAEKAAKAKQKSKKKG